MTFELLRFLVVPFFVLYLSIPQATIQHLNTQNDQLQTALRNMSFQTGGKWSSLYNTSFATIVIMISQDQLNRFR